MKKPYREWSDAEKARWREYQLKRRDRVKKTVIAEYGGQCKHCGISDEDVLTIDHVHDDGAEDRRKGKRSSKDIWEHLRGLHYPKDRYQLLCANCNMKKMIRYRRRNCLTRIEMAKVNGPS